MNTIFSDDLFKTILQTLAVLTGIINLGFLIAQKVMQARTKPKSGVVFQTLRNLKDLKIDGSFKDIYLDEYKRLSFYEIYKVNLDPKNQRRLYKFQRRLKGKYSLNHVLVAVKFFDFSGERIRIRITGKEWMAYAYFTLSSTILIFFGLVAVWLTIDGLIWYKTLLLMAVGLISMTFGLFTIARFLTPVNVALQLKKHTKA